MFETYILSPNCLRETVARVWKTVGRGGHGGEIQRPTKNANICVSLKIWQQWREQHHFHSDRKLMGLRLYSLSPFPVFCIHLRQPSPKLFRDLAICSVSPNAPLSLLFTLFGAPWVICLKHNVWRKDLPFISSTPGCVAQKGIGTTS